MDKNNKRERRFNLRLARGQYKDKKSLTRAKNSLYRHSLIKKATKQELIFKEYLDEKQIRYKFQKGFLKPFHRIVDFYLPKYKLIIEIDGGYHLKTKAKDSLKDTLWSRFKTLRILNSEIEDGSFIKIFSNCIGIFL